MRLATSILAVIAVSPALFGFAAKDVPSWVEEASTRKLPAYPGKVPAAVLLDDQHVTLDQSGTLTLFERRAIKILNQQGKRDATVMVHYWKNRRDVKDLHAWLVAPSGFQKTFDKNSVVDIGAFSQDELYTDGRARVIAADNPEVGAVFAYEYTVQEKSLCAQDEYVFQNRLPSLQSRYTLTLPAGWTSKAMVFNQAQIEPTVDGSSYTWQLSNLPYREAEDESGDTFPRLSVSFVPPAGGSSSNAAILNSWADVSRWQSSLAQGQDEVSPEISAKVNQLTAGSKSDYDKLCAIGHYVQGLRYVAIEMNLQNGGGYVPHAANVVFAKQYGDCKDKANLMRCMLKAAGIQSYLVAIWSGDRTHVRPEWPSPDQFNHMILAAKVADSVQAATTIATPLGRLLIFDPTDDQTPVGDLPFYEQDSYALVLAGDRGELVKMPVTKPAANLYEVTADATLLPDGKLSASVLNSKTGQPASRERHHHAAQNADEYKSSYQSFINNTAKGAIISKLTPEDHFDENKFDVKIDFSSPSYGQMMQGRLLVFNPSVVEIPVSMSPVFPKDEKRVGPVVLSSGLYRKTVHIKLPDGFTVDELPVPAHYDTDFAKFSLAFKQEPGMLVVTEELRTEAVTIPPDQFTAVKKFFDNCRGADLQKTVLVKN
jgi:hypothetical protein